MGLRTLILALGLMLGMAAADASTHRMRAAVPCGFVGPAVARAGRMSRVLPIQPARTVVVYNVPQRPTRKNEPDEYFKSEFEKKEMSQRLVDPQVLIAIFGILSPFVIVGLLFGSGYLTRAATTGRALLIKTGWEVGDRKAITTSCLENHSSYALRSSAMALFGKRDLGLTLSDKMEDNILTFTHDESAEDVSKKVVNPKLDPTRKVQRLRPHKMPGWVNDEDGESGVQMDEDEEGGVRRRQAQEEEDEYVPAQHAMKEDKRLQRLEQARTLKPEQQGGSSRRRFEAQVITHDDDEEEEDKRPEEEFVPGDVPAGPTKWDEDDEDDEDAIAKRRAAIRQRLQQRRAEEEEEAKRSAPVELEEDEDDEEDDSEYETDSDESDAGPLALLKPVFIPKHKRELNKDIEREEKEEEEKLRKQKLAMEERKRETKNLVAEQIRREAEDVEQVVDGYGSEGGAPDDDDKPEDDALEFEAWKVRELFRIKRDREQRLTREREKADIERRRKMTDAERAAEDARLGLNKPRQKAKWKFMQKYYHKGAFYLDDMSVRDTADVRLREADAPTGEDKFNKEALPQVMQVKAGKFGRSGQTKWTHLLNEDTTQKGTPSIWTQSEREREQGFINKPQNKWTHQLAGTGDIDVAGRRRVKK